MSCFLSCGRWFRTLFLPARFFLLAVWSATLSQACGLAPVLDDASGKQAVTLDDDHRCGLLDPEDQAFARAIAEANEWEFEYPSHGNKLDPELLEAVARSHRTTSNRVKNDTFQGWILEKDDLRVDRANLVWALYEPSNPTAPTALATVSGGYYSTQRGYDRLVAMRSKTTAAMTEMFECLVKARGTPFHQGDALWRTFTLRGERMDHSLRLLVEGDLLPSKVAPTCSDIADVHQAAERTASASLPRINARLDQSAHQSFMDGNKQLHFFGELCPWLRPQRMMQDPTAFGHEMLYFAEDPSDSIFSDKAKKLEKVAQALQESRPLGLLLRRRQWFTRQPPRQNSFVARTKMRQHLASDGYLVDREPVAAEPTVDACAIVEAMRALVPIPSQDDRFGGARLAWQKALTRRLSGRTSASTDAQKINDRLMELKTRIGEASKFVPADPELALYDDLDVGIADPGYLITATETSFAAQKKFLAQRIEGFIGVTTRFIHN